MKINVFLIYIIASMLFLVACRKRQQPSLRDGLKECDCAKEVSADFLMEEMTSGNTNFAKYTDTDSIYGEKNVRFTSKNDNDEYTWYIGSEVLKTKEVTRYFLNSMVGKTFPITLVTKKKPNNICFPNDDGYDSVVKYLTIAQKEFYDDNGDTAYIEGTYRVKSSSMSDSVEIKIDYVYVNSQDEHWKIYNYDGKGSNCLGGVTTSDIQFNYRQLWIEGSGNCDDLLGNIYVKKGGRVEIHFTTGGYVNGEFVKDKVKHDFIGRKIN